MRTLKVVDDNGLVSKREWDNQIDKLREKISPAIKDISVAKEMIKESIEAIKFPDEKFAILFSGGIDSMLIAFLAKKQGKDFVCYSFGVNGGRDLEFAEKAKDMFDIKFIDYNLDEFEKSLIETIKIVDEEDAVKISVGSVFYPLLKEIKKDGINLVFTGLGSEEIFAGYERHSEAGDINEECWNGLYTIFERDFTRDVKLANNFGLRLGLPFLDIALVESAMRIDASLKIKDGYKKYILRKVAEEIGVDKQFCWRKKKAAQYGSKANKEFLRIAKRNGFKTRKEFVKSLLG
jgi:asparagine synthase (glutamine-hydrolysing)